jgi:hypothetical protein
VQEWGTAVLRHPNFTGNGRFVRITASGINSHPHNVTITKEFPITQDKQSRVEYVQCYHFR